MEVREIKSLDGFEALWRDWDAAFDADPHASVFMSWDWLRGWLEVTRHSWVVLAARENATSPWIGFLPLSLRGSRSALRIDHVREIHMAGHPTADYTGFVCGSTDRPRVVASLARYVARNMAWDRLRFEEVNDPDLAQFIAHMPGDAAIRQSQGTACPRVNLPATWDACLKSLSSATRQSLKKRLKHAAAAFRVARFDGRNDARMIDSLIRMALQRTRDDLDPNTGILGGMLKRCAGAGRAHMLMLYHEDTPVAGVASLIDRKDRSFGLYVTSFDERFAEYSPGRVAVALAIRDAIEAGMKVFDFLRGEEPYKFQFGGVSRHNRTLVIERPTLQAALRRGLSGVREQLRMLRDSA
jgi:CelD/BcsL family acetyltransferase involved in cellulose biosynthesis